MRSLSSIVKAIGSPFFLLGLSPTLKTMRQYRFLRKRMNMLRKFLQPLALRRYLGK